MRVSEIQPWEGVHTPSVTTLDPRQSKFMSLYINPRSKTFANCYQSALAAGFSNQTAKNLTHNKPGWYSEILGQIRTMEPEHILAKLQHIINNPNEPTQNVLKAIDMLMKHSGMYKPVQNSIVAISQLNIEAVL